MSTPALRQTPRNCFISHAHADNSLCTPYADGLKKRGVEVWYDLDNAPEGHRLTSVLQRELQAREALIVFVTSAALESFWVDLEIGAYLGLMAQDHSRMLLPVRLKLCEMPPFLNSVLWIDAVSLTVDDAVERVIQALRTPEPAGSRSFRSGAPSPAVRTDVNVALAASVPAVHAATAQRLMEEARAETLASHWNDAIVKLEFALSLSGIVPSAEQLTDLAVAYSGASRWDNALTATQEALKLDPWRPDLLQMQGRAHTGRARILLGRGKENDGDEATQHITEALLSYDRARALMPRDDLPGRLALLADRRDALTVAGRWEDALANVDDELTLAPNAPTRLASRLDLLRRLGRTADALNVARTLASRSDATVQDRLNLVRLLYASGAERQDIEGALKAAGVAAGTDVAQQRAVSQTRAELLSLPPRLAGLGFRIFARDKIEWIVPPTCSVPAGPFHLGSDKTRDKEAQGNETIRRTIDLPAFHIARYPVTVAEYLCFLTAKGWTGPQGWLEQLKRLDHPVVSVNWIQASSYASWLSELTSQPWRLPSEAVWEKAARFDARATSGERIYPWGDTFEAARCNTSESNQGGTTAVGWYGPRAENEQAGRRTGASPCGAEDMAGNVWEWTGTTYVADYGAAGQVWTDIGSAQQPTIRGGSFRDGPNRCRAATRGSSSTSATYNFLGFRLVLMSAEP